MDPFLETAKILSRSSETFRERYAAVLDAWDEAGEVLTVVVVGARPMRSSEFWTVRGQFCRGRLFDCP
jgi:hypothetical protein